MAAKHDLALSMLLQAAGVRAELCLHPQAAPREACVASGKACRASPHDAVLFFLLPLLLKVVFRKPYLKQACLDYHESTASLAFIASVEDEVISSMLPLPVRFC